MKELPAEMQNYWKFLTTEEQRSVIACLSSNLKPMKFSIKVQAQPEPVARMLKYLGKYNLKYEAKAIGKKICFTFESHSTRNEVLIGMNCV